ncbi:MAG: hypothetical protein JWO30_2048 [Fibrobacteres bacterium]|nr:hypothetical protein [Fibrobacterota bacterium]
MRRFFGFESDFVDSLRCIPMQVRMQLDVSGVKLKLNEWSKFKPEDRLALSNRDCGTPEAIFAYRSALFDLVARTSGAPPSMLSELPEPVWEDAGRIPEQVLIQAHGLGLEIGLEAWSRLDPLERFALVKLSRAGHENRNFLPAMKEFGLA